MEKLTEKMRGEKRLARKEKEIMIVIYALT
jgi:hypothetical protein